MGYWVLNELLRSTYMSDIELFALQFVKLCERAGS